MRARTNLLIDVAAISIYLIATNPVATGTPVHECLSIGAALIAFVHLVRHWDWTVHVAQRIVRRLGAASRVNFVVDVALLVAFVTVVMSGLAVSRSALEPLGRVVSETSPWHAIHSQSSTVLLALMGLHLGLHWHWLASTFRHQVVTPLSNPGATHQRAGSVASRPRNAAGARPRRGRLHSVGNVVATALVTLAIASAVYFAVGATGGRVLPTWLALPGAPGAALSTLGRPLPAPGDRADVAAAVEPASAAAQGFDGTPAERIAVRAGHSLVVVTIAMLLGVALRGLLKSG